MVTSCSVHTADARGLFYLRHSSQTCRHHSVASMGAVRVTVPFLFVCTRASTAVVPPNVWKPSSRFRKG
jgi:hypothetical protein